MEPENIKKLAEQALAAMKDPATCVRLVGPAPTDAGQNEMKVRIANTFRKNVPKTFRWVASPDKLRARVFPPDEIDRATQFAARLRSITIVGPSGTGKTSLAMACYLAVAVKATETLNSPDGYTHKQRQRILQAALGAVVLTARKLARGTMEAPLGKGLPPLIESAMNAPLLILDDLGQELEIYRSSASMVGEVIQERHAEQRPTIVTTFKSNTDLTKDYGDGIRRRLRSWEVVELKRRPKGSGEKARP